MCVCVHLRGKKKRVLKKVNTYEKNRTIIVKCVERIDTKVEKLLPSMSLMNNNSLASDAWRKGEKESLKRFYQASSTS